MRSGAKVSCSTFLKKEKRLLGRVNLLFLKTPTRFSPSIIITKDATRPNIAENMKLTPNVLPISPSIPPNIANPASRPTWKRRKGFLFFLSSCTTFAESERTRPPTIARQLERDAIIPMRKPVTGVTAPPIPRFRIPDF